MNGFFYIVNLFVLLLLKIKKLVDVILLLDQQLTT